MMDIIQFRTCFREKKNNVSLIITKLDVERISLITKWREFSLTKDWQDQFQSSRAQQEMFWGKVGRGNPWTSKIFDFPKK